MTLSVPLILAVLAAGALGALLRFSVVQLFARTTHNEGTARTGAGAATTPGFPWAVLVVNGVGSAAGGLILGLQSVDALAPAWALILLTGLCGGLTTFSTFSVDTILLVDRGLTRIASANVALNLVVGLAAAGLAFGLVTAVAVPLVAVQ
jgi:CrcB protein